MCVEIFKHLFSVKLRNELVTITTWEGADKRDPLLWQALSFPHEITAHMKIG